MKIIFIDRENDVQAQVFRNVTSLEEARELVKLLNELNKGGAFDYIIKDDNDRAID
jgi:hypothetical protein